MGLAQKGLPHRVAAFHRRGFFLDAVELACGPVHEVAIRHFARPSTLREVVRLAQFLRREQIDILHAWDSDSAIFGQFAAPWAGVKLVTSHRDLGQIYPPHKLALMRRADRIAVRVVANAEAVRDHFIEQGCLAHKIEVLPNMVDLDEFDLQARQPFSKMNRLPSGRRMVIVNRLDTEKNTGLLIETLPLVRREIPDAVLIVAGDGTEMKSLQAKALSLGVAEFVSFLGEVMDVPALLPLCEVGALVPKMNEGLSNTILEYMAAGLPVLATHCGGNRELVRDGETGWVVSENAKAIETASKWISLLKNSDESRLMGAAGRKTVEGRYHSEVVLDSFARFYRQILFKNEDAR